MSSSIEDFYSKKIPNLNKVRTKKKEAKKVPINSWSSFYKERLKDIKKAGLAGENYYYRKNNPPYFQKIPGSIPYLLLRESLVEKLKNINKKLEKIGLEVYLFDGYRPIAVQQYIRDVWLMAYLKKQKPFWPKEKIKKEINKYWAKVNLNTLAKTPPPHSTGGALDLTLRKIKTGDLITMGSQFDILKENAFTDYFENLRAKKKLSFYEIEAMENRRLLYWLMASEGFANNPNEWWHYSWGEQVWAKLKNKKNAFYSYLDINNLKA
ncbi:MAG: M15 family metallopeptidase [Candidatus Paceibacterota bacterium]|jgi:D-alanyl-D-alanine dipeptidase|nr:M15 family metallopeptidase [Candidatus Paceibacterota bacterium]MDD3548444.1 M15 family metallopeptidase [Candidatus Paceibacterota bacterium]MDD4999289.1 M15 family metallopeptidase [Candidatus Paceibacterota bacterium]MDD5545382.1 M15 family metallopeptidase [Candidatus Paceibacterota bacterium]